MLKLHLTKLKNFNNHKQKINSLKFDSKGLLLASGSDDQSVIIYNLNTNANIKLIDSEKSGWFSLVNAVNFCDKNNILINATEDRYIKLWSTITGQKILSFIAHSESVTTIAVHPTKDIIASGGKDKLVKLWTINNGQNIYTFEGHSGAISSVLFSPDGKTIASGGDSSDKTIRLWDLLSNNVKILNVNSAWFTGISSLSFSSNNQLLASSIEDGTIKIWDAQGTKELINLHAHSDKVRDLIISPNNLFLASVSSDKTLRIWELTSYKCIFSFSHEQEVTSVAISPDSQIIAVGLSNGLIQLYEIQYLSYM